MQREDAFDQPVPQADLEFGVRIVFRDAASRKAGSGDDVVVFVDAERRDRFHSPVKAVFVGVPIGYLPRFFGFGDLRDRQRGGQQQRQEFIGHVVSVADLPAIYSCPEAFSGSLRLIWAKAVPYCENCRYREIGLSGVFSCMKLSFFYTASDAVIRRL